MVILHDVPEEYSIINTAAAIVRKKTGRHWEDVRDMEGVSVVLPDDLPPWLQGRYPSGVVAQKSSYVPPSTRFEGDAFDLGGEGYRVLWKLPGRKQG